MNLRDNGRKFSQSPLSAIDASIWTRDLLEKGVLFLAQTLPKSEVAAIKRTVLSELDRLTLRSNGKLAGAKIQSLPLFLVCSIGPITTTQMNLSVLGMVTSF